MQVRVSVGKSLSTVVSWGLGGNVVGANTFCWFFFFFFLQGS